MICPTCQAWNPEGARFCNNCGTALGAPQALDGERRLVTILFADVVGSTAWAERVDPEEWTEIMNGAMRFMIRAVTRYEGTVARLMGDGLLALFGAPVSHEDDAERAVLAALEISAAAADYSARLERRYGSQFGVRCGINTGLSVLTHVGDENKTEYTAMGDSANLAARLQALAPPQGILIGPETHALVRHAFETRQRGEETIKGKTGAVATYEVLAPLTGVGKARGLEGVSSPFVGRDAELGALRRALQRARAGEAGVTFVVGEAGLGKSRLLAELRRQAGNDVTWLEGRAISYARNAPYHPWRQLLVASLGLPEGAPPGDVSRRLSEMHLAAGQGDAIEAPTERSVQPPAQRPAWYDALALLLGVEGAEGRAAGLGSDAQDAASGITAAVAAHLRRLERDATVVVVLEDVHWADQGSVRLVESLAGVLTDERVLIVCPMRPDRQSRAWELMERAQAGRLDADGARTEVIRLRALDAAHAEALLDDLLAIEGMPDAMRSKILEKAEGNPFYLEEVIRSLIDSGHVVREGDRWRARQEITEVAVPDTVAGVLSARIDRLPENSRQVAQTASVIGREFASRLLRAVMRDRAAHAAPPDIGPQLRNLTVEELVSETGLRSDIDYRFKHELTRDAAYQRLLLKRRRELHGRVGEELEALYGDRTAEVAKDLAHHYLLSERWLEAARWSLAAAQYARRLYSLPEAQELIESAMSALDRQLEGTGEAEAQVAPSEARELRVEAVTELVNLGLFMRLHEDPARRPALVERAERAVELARGLDDKRFLVTSLVNLGNVHALSGFPGTGFGALLEAHDLARELGDDHLFLLPFWVATEIMLDDDPAMAAAQFDKVVELARNVGNKDIEAHALGSRTAALARLGEFEAAQEVGELALAAAEASGSIIKRADVGMLVGSAYLEMGHLQPGIEHLERGTDLALSVNGFECACNGLHLLGLGQMADKHLEEAEHNLRRSLDVGVGTARESLLHSVRADLASAHFLAGDVAAIEEIEKEIDNAEALNDGYGAARARLSLAEALLSIDQPARADGHVARAIGWFRAQRMDPYVLKGLNLRAATLDALGDREGSAAARKSAAESRDRIKWPKMTQQSRQQEPGPGAGRAAGSGAGTRGT